MGVSGDGFECLLTEYSHPSPHPKPMNRFGVKVTKNLRSWSQENFYVEVRVEIRSGFGIRKCDSADHYHKPKPNIQISIQRRVRNREERYYDCVML